VRDERDGRVVLLSISAATNRITTPGFAYDAAGNLVQWPGGTVTLGAEYDVDGRLSVVTQDGWASVRYYYDARNLRVKRGEGWMARLELYGLNGELLGVYRPATSWPVLCEERVYFAGRLVEHYNAEAYYWESPTRDRLGSLRAARRYPFGEGNTVDNDEFATYRKDASTQQYYAWHRYYSATWGRFSSPDPYVMSGGLTNPQGWNRYSYVANDPVNYYDPSGLMQEAPTFKITVTAPAMGLGEMELWWLLTRRNWILEHGAGGLTSPEVSKGSGGGGLGSPVRIERYSTSSVPAVAVQNALRWLQMAIALDESCDKWLTNNRSTIDFLLGQAPGWSTMFAGVAEFPDNPTINAVAGVSGTTLAAGSAGLIVNVRGAFFSTSQGAGAGTNIKGGTDAAKAFILLHELAHLTAAEGFLSNDRDEKSQQANNAMVLENCGTTVLRAAGMLP